MNKYRVTIEVEVEVTAESAEAAKKAAEHLKTSYMYGYGTLGGVTGYQTRDGAVLVIKGKKVSKVQGESE